MTVSQLRDTSVTISVHDWRTVEEMVTNGCQVKYCSEYMACLVERNHATT